MCAPPWYSCSSGTNVIWIGIAIMATTKMKSQLRPLKGIHANAYAAAAASRIGMIVAGSAMASELSSARPNDTCPPGGSNRMRW
jgi:hypothetical protein